MPLEDWMAAIIDYRGKTPRKTTSGIPLVTAKIVKNGRIEAPEEFIAEADYDDWMRRGIPEPGDVVLTTEAPLGEVAQLDDTKIALAQRIITLRGKPDLLDNTYLRFALQSAPIQEQLRGRASGSTVSGIKQSELRKLALRFPPVDEQRRVAAVLVTLDDKIDINRRINQTLEATAQAIFKSWFVDFDPVKAKIAAIEQGQDPLRAAMRAISGKTDAELDQMPREHHDQLAATAALFPDAMEESELGEIPRGWKVGSLSNLASFQNGYAFKTKDWTNSGYPVIKIGNVKPGIIDLSGCSFVAHETVADLERFSLKRGDLLVGMTGYVGETGLIPALDSVAYLNQRVGRIYTSSRINDVGYPFCLVRDPRYKAYAESKAHGSAQANVSGKDLMDYAVVLPNAEILNIFNVKAARFINSLLSYHEESQSLASLRDTLLPKLLSGELSVEDIPVEVAH